MFTHEMIKSFNQLEMDVYNYIVSNEEKVVYMKVRELAEAVHVSTTTILRFWVAVQFPILKTNKQIYP